MTDTKKVEEAVELLPCPFCGGRPERYTVLPQRGFENRQVHCQRCGASAFDLKWNIRLTAPPTRPADDRWREKLRELVAPWADHHGDLPDYDHPLACVFDSGVQHAVELLAKKLDVDDWTPCDGTEEYDGDLGGTLMNIVLAAMPKDRDGDPIWPKDLAALSTAQPSVEEGRYLVWSNEHAAWWGADRCGYTRAIARAGRYSRDEALSIAGTRDGGWHVSKGNPDEIAIPERDALDQYADITRVQDHLARAALASPVEGGRS